MFCLHRPIVQAKIREKSEEARKLDDDLEQLNISAADLVKKQEALEAQERERVEKELQEIRVCSHRATPQAVHLLRVHVC